jgi:hypothetical protein
MKQELLEMAADWKKAAREMIQKSETGSRSEMVNQMLFACAEMLEWKIANIERQARAVTLTSALEER